MLGDLENTNYIGAIADLAPLVGDIQVSMQNCSHFDLDFKELDNWAE